MNHFKAHEMKKSVRNGQQGWRLAYACKLGFRRKQTKNTMHLFLGMCTVYQTTNKPTAPKMHRITYRVGFKVGSFTWAS